MTDQSKTKEQKIEQLKQLIHTAHNDGVPDAGDHWDFRKVYKVVCQLDDSIWSELMESIDRDAVEPQHLTNNRLSAGEYGEEDWLRDLADTDDYCTDIDHLVQLLGRLRKQLGDNLENRKVLWDPVEEEYYLVEVRDITDEELDGAIEGMAEMVEEGQEDRDEQAQWDAEKKEEAKQRQVKAELMRVAERIGLKDALCLLTDSESDDE